MPPHPNTHARLLRSDGVVRSAHIVSTYPVRWSAFAVLRDFIQNFFDETGPLRFASAVAMDIGRSGVLISMPSRGFELDWLTHIGASTKTQAMAGTTAGYFGEGFKIAALCAVRDLGWQVSMGSMDWSAAVTLSPERFGETRVEVLAYHVTADNVRPGTTWLELEGLDARELTLLPLVRDAFCYPENPWLGEPLDLTRDVSVYLRSDVPIPDHLPFVAGRRTEGLLFLGHQARGTLPIPFAIAMNRVRTGERDRPSLYDFQIVDALRDAARLMSPGTAGRVLSFLQSKWRASPPRRFAVGSWSNVVTALVHRIATDPDAIQTWKASVPLALVCEPVKRGDVRAGNRRRRSLAWARHTLPGVPRVQAAFAQLGYPLIEDACEQAGGFPPAIAPSVCIQQRIIALETYTESVLGRLFTTSHVPRVEIMNLRGAGWEGIAESTREVKGSWSHTGRRLRRRILKITLDQEAMMADSPFPALATYIHERAHAFGGDESAGFSAALTDAIRFMASAPSALTQLEANWLAASSLEGDIP